MSTQVNRAAGRSPDATLPDDPLYVRSVEKAFRVLTAFDTGRPTLSLAQIAVMADLDRSAAQRFAHTLERLGYLRKDPQTRRFELTTRTLDLGYHYTRASPLVERTLPYLQHLSRTTEESVSLTVLDGTEIVFVSRLVSRHMLDTNVIVGTRLPAYCTAPGIAMLSRLPADEARTVLSASNLRAYTPHTTWRMPDLLRKLAETAQRGYAVARDEIFPGDISIAAPILGPAGRPVAAVNIAVSGLRIQADEAERQFSSLVISAARSMSQPVALAS